MPSWKPEFLVSGKWARNGVAFATEAEAKENAADLFMRWTTPEDYRAVEVDEPPTHTYIDGQLGHLAKEITNG